MTEDVKALLGRYRPLGLLIDTNILLLYVVGLGNRERIAKFKRTKQFIPEDFDLLCQIVASFQTVVTTPNILTEVNSFVNQLGEPERYRCLALLGQIMTNLREEYQASAMLSGLPEFPQFGLTDCGITSAARDRYLVLTDDLRLTVHLQSQGIDAVNFNNIRPLGWA